VAKGLGQATAAGQAGGVNDHSTAEMIAEDLRTYLAARSATLDGPVYAVSLYSEIAYGSVGVNIATEPDMRRTLDAPAYRVADPVWLSGPASPRWNSGNWSCLVEAFTSPATEAAVEPLRVLVRDDQQDLPEKVVLDAFNRWARLTLESFDLVDVLADLDTVPQALAFVEFPDGDTVDTAEAIQWAMGAERLHAAIPHWRELAAAVREARAEPERLRLLATPPPGRYDGYGPPPADDPAPDPVLRWLRACGLTARDFTETSERLVRALAVGESRGDDRGIGFEL
jgi:hypothetical protein